MNSRWRRSLIRSALLDALAVLAPTSCSGCGAADRALCEACRSALRPHPNRVVVPGTRALPVHHVFDYGGVARRVLVALKDAGRTDAAPALAAPLRCAIEAALDGCGEADVELVTVPSSRAAFRRRGYRPVDLVLARAGLRPSLVLRASRAVADQAGLGAGERRSNRDRSLQATRAATGRNFLLVDDILTTGSTLLEATRALEEAGGHVLGAAVLAYTRRHTANPILPDNAGQVHW